ncbi:hypothetical protein EV700_1113 [Fluviicoccus keumensis]|uniref:NAD(FAD)-utilizing dehydrogenase n=1 Tax=Fluviicoccus keumensis TaxID=1435465 RepID=A0A4Q7Z884_9GAMM|nr:TIGR03862 family flavoprotein [Fluviicoccus keumensis]RZU46732.1 hypothetical protein EV700_1113 [Fluviicoccus keumensis]
MPASHHIAVIGGGPAGLLAAETLLQAGRAVTLYDAKPSLGRKFLMAGKSGLNLTHAEPLDDFLSRYGESCSRLEPMIRELTPQALRDWAHGLGVPTFVGSSGRVFPEAMKAAPLLRAWLHRLRGLGLQIRVRHRWTGWTEDGALRFETADGEITDRPAACVLALGGGSWARLGSDGAWLPWLAEKGVTVAPLKAANCGFDVAWTPAFRERFAGQPVKTVEASCRLPDGDWLRKRGDLMVTGSGLEGGLVYALSAPLRDQLLAGSSAELMVDLLPDRDLARVEAELAKPRNGKSLSSVLRSRLNLPDVKSALVRECLPADILHDPAQLAAALKALPIRLAAVRPMDEAISTAGGVRFEALNDALMLTTLPGVFCAGEMLDWEAPTGGYLLTACFASGLAAARGVLAYLDRG